MSKESNQYHVIFGTGPVGMALMRELSNRGMENIRVVNRGSKLSIHQNLNSSKN